MHGPSGWVTPPALHAIDRGQQMRRNAAAPVRLRQPPTGTADLGVTGEGNIDWALAGPPTASNVTTARQNHRMGAMIAAKP